MTIEEFDNTAWSAGMTARYHGLPYAVASVDFREKLIALAEIIDDIDDGYGCETEDDHWVWVRCENCEILKGAFHE